MKKAVSLLLAAVIVLGCHLVNRDGAQTPVTPTDRGGINPQLNLEIESYYDEAEFFDETYNLQIIGGEVLADEGVRLQRAQNYTREFIQEALEDIHRCRENVQRRWEESHAGENPQRQGQLTSTYLYNYTLGFMLLQMRDGEIPYNALHRRMLERVLSDEMFNVDDRLLVCRNRYGDGVSRADIVNDISSDIDCVWQDFIKELYFEHRFQLWGYQTMRLIIQGFRNREAVLEETSELGAGEEEEQEMRNREAQFQEEVDESNQEAAREETTELETLEEQEVGFQELANELFEQRLILNRDNFVLANYWIDLLEIFECHIAKKGSNYCRALGQPPEVVIANILARYEELRALQHQPPDVAAEERVSPAL